MFLKYINLDTFKKLFFLLLAVALFMAAVQMMSSVSTQVNTGAYVASGISVSGGNGRVKASDGEMWITVTYTTVTATQCSWKAFWSDGTQIGSEQKHACGDEGKDSYLEWLSEKIGEKWSTALKAFKGW